MQSNNSSDINMILEQIDNAESSEESLDIGKKVNRDAERGLSIISEDNKENNNSGSIQVSVR